ncbi:AMP-binding protein [Pandoraea sp. XJJ-1]|uniref:Long-chain-fatty-acid--CoA ligase n=1 Tax=Pandoraea cepalis TaxID=2508294 RepID=A0A5E4TPH0_9BURK|nr:MULTISPECIES: AMP-binding protein [Pandoraea]OJY23149.1 MAG: long-chain fatty acid--CoA ligase [Pandoraea sp. 64-18]WAL80842.1 AMP-binding protein [Pandoraea sp. XJJ-1]BDD93992.1 long-chain-fatty-acid--CoA ligase [Pandoraea sp. NE5]VVD89725.1 long-chain fatty acid--CoA ligase [Pandoraea cepalis]
MDSAVQHERVWLDAYPPGVPADIDTTRYTSLVQAFDEWIDKYRERIAFVSLGSEITYGEVARQAYAFAAWLQAHGVQKGERVALMMPNCFQYPIGLFGTLIAGAVVVNVNPLYTVRELKHQLQDSGARTIVAFENFAKTVQDAIPGTEVRHVLVTQIGDLLGTGLNVKGRLVNFLMRRIAKQVPPYDLPQAIPLRRALAEGAKHTPAPVPLARDDLAFLQYTGGTTGVAKGAMLTHGNVLANLLQTEAWAAGQLDGDIEVNLSLLPMYHILSLTVNCLVFMSLGGRNILIANPRDVKKVVYIIRNETFTGVTGVNTLFNGLLENQDFCARDFSRLKLSLAGGMATQRAIAERWKQVTGKPIIEGYGLTECSPIVTMNPVDLSHMDEVDFTGSIGLPAPSTDVRFKRDDGTWADLGEPGELCVRGPQVMRGYWQRPEDTANTFDADGWLMTGDVGVMDARGYVRLIDRKKDMILVSGFNVYPNEIEDVVMLHPGVREAAVVGVPDPVAGERVKLVVVAKDPGVTTEILLAHCREHLTAYKVPRIVEFRDGELPKSTVGKILRRELRAPLGHA